MLTRRIGVQVDRRYVQFTLADPTFYDIVPSAVKLDDFAEGTEPPPRWLSTSGTVWRELRPAGHRLRPQGWKLHVSATPENAARVLVAVANYCFTHVIPFKHLRSMRLLIQLNSKAGRRSGSGKILTVYPASDEQLQRILDDLSVTLAGEPGPYILSDLRIGNGPLYVRYGAFHLRMAEIDRQQVPVIERPDGVLVLDERRPSLRIPDWAPVPDFLQPHLAARQAGPSTFPYEIVNALHYSNGGGVYRALTAEGTSIVLKEARPYAGLDEYCDDAVTRLRREHDTLSQLAGVPGVPEVIDYFRLWEHEYLAMEHRDGVHLGAWMAQNYPLMDVDAAGDELSRYAARVARIGDKLERILDAIHERGLVHGDLHSSNVLIGENDTVSLIDFEVAYPATEQRRPALGAAGFRPPRDRTGTAVDDYGLAILRLRMVLPYVSMYEVDPGKAHEHLAFAEQRFPLTFGYADAVRTVLPPARARDAGRGRETRGWSDDACSEILESIATAILASATPERADRLFPGDIAQFTVGGACFGYGAAGVLYALDVAGAGRFAEHEKWLLRSVTTTPPPRPGFYDGAHGIAYVLSHLGNCDAAAELIDRARPMVETTRNHDLESGLAGIGLNLLHLATTWGSAELELEAFRVADRVQELFAAAPPPGREGQAGLAYGWCGAALLALRLYEHTGDEHWLDLAELAVERDLEECVEAGDDSLQVRDPIGRRTLPYLQVGSAGALVVLDQLAAHRPSEARRAAVGKLIRACASEIVAQPGLMLGRAGLILALTHIRHRDELVRRVTDRHVDALALHAVRYRHGIAFPGNQLMRLSMDVNTGSAGVLLALAAADTAHVALPFLRPADRAPARRRN